MSDYHQSYDGWASSSEIYSYLYSFSNFLFAEFLFFFFFDIFRFVRSYSRIFLSSFAWPRSCIISRRLTITRELRLLINFKNDIWKKLRLGWDLERKNRNHFKVKLEIVLSLDWIFKFLKNYDSIYVNCNFARRIVSYPFSPVSQFKF